MRSCKSVMGQYNCMCPCAGGRFEPHHWDRCPSGSVALFSPGLCASYQRRSCHLSCHKNSPCPTTQSTSSLTLDRRRIMALKAVKEHELRHALLLSKVAGYATSSDTSTFASMSLPPEIREMIYTVLRKAIRVINAKICNLNLNICYDCVESIDRSQVKCLPIWLLSSETIQREAFDQLRVHSTWAVSLIGDRASRQDKALPYTNIKFSRYSSMIPIKVFRITYSLIPTNILSTGYSADYAWKHFMPLARSLAGKAQNFQFGLTNNQDTFLLVQQIRDPEPYWPACRQVCEEHVTKVGQTVIGEEGSFSVKAGEGVPPRSVLFTHTRVGRISSMSRSKEVEGTLANRIRQCHMPSTIYMT